MALKTIDAKANEEKGKLLSLLKELGAIRTEVVHRDPQLSSYYLDAKKGYGDYRVAELMCNLLSSEVPEEATCIVVSGYGGYIAPLIQNKLHLKLSIMKDAAKSHHGEDELFNGVPPTSKDIAVIFDDTLASGKSAVEICEAVNSRGAKVAKYFFIYKRGRNPDLGGILEYHIFNPEELET